MPRRRRRHAITETPAVRAAFDRLCGESVTDRGEGKALRRRLADRVRSRALPVDADAADRVRRTGWARGWASRCCWRA